MTLNRKQKIEKAFDQKASIYNRYAILQKQSAQNLCNLIDVAKPQKILEIGCGTGFLTENLQQKFPNADILATDISKNMIHGCRQKFTGYMNLDFQIMDGEHINTNKKYDLIVSNLSVQWFHDPKTGIKNICKNLNADGKFYFSTIGSKSFWQWKNTLEELNLPSGILNIPDYDGIFHEEEKINFYKNAEEFLQNLKNIGAHSASENYKPMTIKNFRKACKTFDSTHKGDVTWHLLYGALNALGRPLHQD